MPRLIAFLRAINVGGHTVKMDELRLIFESMGFSNVETFIASGNAIFDTTAQSGPALAQRIADRLREALGYAVATFIRTPEEVAAVVRHPAFPQPALNSAGAFNVAFLSTAPAPASTQQLLALRTEIDDFSVYGREVYWLCRVKQSESTFSNAALEKALGMPATMRGINTLRKLALKFPA